MLFPQEIFNMETYLTANVNGRFKEECCANPSFNFRGLFFVRDWLIENCFCRTECATVVWQVWRILWILHHSIRTFYRSDRMRGKSSVGRTWRSLDICTTCNPTRPHKICTGPDHYEEQKPQPNTTFYWVVKITLRPSPNVWFTSVNNLIPGHSQNSQDEQRRSFIRSFAGKVGQVFRKHE